jgi:hypothetical protein
MNTMVRHRFGMKAAVPSSKRPLNGEFKCSKCSQSFPKGILLVSHAWNVHGLRMGFDGSIKRRSIREKRADARAKLGKISKAVKISKVIKAIEVGKVGKLMKHKVRCDICGKKLKSLKYLSAHKIRKHGRERLELQIKALQDQLALVSGPVQPVGTPMVITHCDECGNNVWQQNMGKLAIEQAVKNGSGSLKLKVSKE